MLIDAVNFKLKNFYAKKSIRKRLYHKVLIDAVAKTFNLNFFYPTPNSMRKRLNHKVEVGEC